MGKHFLRYPKKNISTARMLRKNMTDAERILWSRIRNNQLGVKFRRQVPGPYILDFLSVQSKLVIELDGSRHYTLQGIEKDRTRDQYLEKIGLTILRYPVTEFLEDVDEIVDEIYDHIQKRTTNQNAKA